MSATVCTLQGRVVSLLRYPVKSMQGEELNSVWVSPRGLLGDRAFAVVSADDGKVASAKNPRKWPRMFEFRAAYLEQPRPDQPVPPVMITLPDGTIVRSTDSDLDRVLSGSLQRDVKLVSAAPERPVLEEYWPDLIELDRRDTVTDEAMPTETFFDCAAVHLLTTNTLATLQQAATASRFEVRRFRPNLVVALDNTTSGFVENEWHHQTLAIGDDVRLQISGPCPRCVMTTLAQSDLPADLQVLRTAAQRNNGHVGVYASVLRGGRICRGDAIWLAE